MGQNCSINLKSINLSLFTFKDLNKKNITNPMSLYTCLLEEKKF